MRHVCHIIWWLCCWPYLGGEKQIEIRSNCGRFCAFRNCEFFGVNIRNELLKKSLIIERDKVINVTI